MSGVGSKFPFLPSFNFHFHFLQMAARADRNIQVSNKATQLTPNGSQSFPSSLPSHKAN
jgi:hypothetical protein